MEDVTKIDIIGQDIFCYNEDNGNREIYPLIEEYDFFMNAFSDTQDLLTVNITVPIARVMKFYTIENSIPESFIELDYADMTEENQGIFNAFVAMIKSKN
jgi:hypothetical protein